jgi:ubiquitin carboxyl-terminal hydrolase L3
MDEVYFMKQIESLGNACGTIALLHAVGNARSEISLCKLLCTSALLSFCDTFFPQVTRGY